MGKIRRITLIFSEILKTIPSIINYEQSLTESHELPLKLFKERDFTPNIVIETLSQASKFWGFLPVGGYFIFLTQGLKGMNVWFLSANEKDERLMGRQGIEAGGGHVARGMWGRQADQPDAFTRPLPPCRVFKRTPGCRKMPGCGRMSGCRGHARMQKGRRVWENPKWESSSSTKSWLKAQPDLCVCFQKFITNVLVSNSLPETRESFLTFSHPQTSCESARSLVDGAIPSPPAHFPSSQQSSL